MPEGPECRRISENLAHFSNGKVINAVSALSGRYVKSAIEGLASASFPTKIDGWGVKGKFIYAVLDNNFAIWNTLGMSGSWKTEYSKHARVKIDFADGDVLYFTDARNFGTFKLVEGKQALLDKLDSLGPDMLSDSIDDNTFRHRMVKRSDKTVCEAIMDQSVICGVGNYVKADSLWLSRISPHRKVRDLTDSDMSRLNDAIKKVLRASYSTGGATIKSYSDLNGEVGEYSSRFLVYSRKTDSHGNPVVREETPDGRTTHWCPQIQN